MGITQNIWCLFKQKSASECRGTRYPEAPEAPESPPQLPR
jgi:hypothetical protein